MHNLLLNPHTENQLNQIRDNVPHALIISGKKGVGLSEAVQYITHVHTNFPVTISPNEKDSITVEVVRSIYSQSNTKNSKKQIFIIDQAEKMSQSAQNALLKRLEEPIHNVSFILVTHTPQLLLPTIQSRAQSVHVLPLTTTQYDTYIKRLKATDIQKRQIKYIAEGLQAETNKLLQDEEYFTKRTQEIGLAKQFLQANTYNKLILAHKLSKDRVATQQLLLDCARIIETMLKSKPNVALTQQLNNVLNVYENISEDRNVRIQCMRLVI